MSATRVQQFLRDEQGSTAIEYALIAVILSVVITASVIGISESLTNIFTDVRDGFDSANQLN